RGGRGAGVRGAAAHRAGAEGLARPAPGRPLRQGAHPRGAGDAAQGRLTFRPAPNERGGPRAGPPLFVHPPIVIDRVQKSVIVRPAVSRLTSYLFTDQPCIPTRRECLTQRTGGPENCACFLWSSGSLGETNLFA